MTDTLNWLETSLQAALDEVSAIADEVNNVCDIVRVPDLLLELHVMPTDPETDKLNLIEFSRAELEGRIDWGERPPTHG